MIILKGLSHKRVFISILTYWWILNSNDTVSQSEIVLFIKCSTSRYLR